MSDMRRRDLLELLALAPLPALGWSPDLLRRAATAARDALQSAERGGGAPQTPAFFTPHEWRTVRLLADLVIPRDERSGSATDAGVPEFLDFIMADQEDSRTPMRGGLAWLDRQCRRRWNAPFADCTAAQQTELLDQIAWPERAPAGMGPGVAFFNRFRDWVATGFWSSKMGVEDLGYLGNTFVREWTGCPEAELRRLGLDRAG